jgi:hypothetical protein
LLLRYGELETQSPLDVFRVGQDGAKCKKIWHGTDEEGRKACFSSGNFIDASVQSSLLFDWPSESGISRRLHLCTCAPIGAPLSIDELTQHLTVREAPMGVAIIDDVRFQSDLAKSQLRCPGCTLRNTLRPVSRGTTLFCVACRSLLVRRADTPLFVDLTYYMNPGKASFILTIASSSEDDPIEWIDLVSPVPFREVDRNNLGSVKNHVRISLRLRASITSLQVAAILDAWFEQSERTYLSLMESVPQAASEIAGVEPIRGEGGRCTVVVGRCDRDDPATLCWRGKTYDIAESFAIGRNLSPLFALLGYFEHFSSRLAMLSGREQRNHFSSVNAAQGAFERDLCSKKELDEFLREISTCQEVHQSALQEPLRDASCTAQDVSAVWMMRSADCKLKATE